jgi:ssDNA-binding replication factor A large subunit
MENKRRPCPPGEGCTVKIADKAVKKRKDKERRALSVEQQKRKAERDRLYREKKKKTKLCRYCGREFMPSASNYFFCCEECKEAQNKENRRKADIRNEEKRKAARAAARSKNEDCT